MSEDYSYTPPSTEDGSDGEPQPYADTPLPYVEQPSRFPHEEQPSPSAQQPSPFTKEAQLAAAYQLGNVLKRYKREPPTSTTSEFPRIDQLVLRGKRENAEPGFEFILIGLIITLLVWVISGISPWLLILICSLILAPWLSNVIGSEVTVSLQNTEFYLCTNGLMMIKGKRVQALRWEQIQAIQRGRTHNIWRPYYILYLDEGKAITLRWSLIGEGIKELGKTIEREISQRLLPEAIVNYEAGQMLNFGSITVTAQGLTFEDEQQSLPWERFATIDYYNGHSFNGHSFAIREGATASIWQEIEVETMLNFCVFLPLTTHIQNRLRESRYKNNGTPIRETVEEGAAQGYDAYDGFYEVYNGIQEPLPGQEEEQERKRRVQEEILERLRSSRRAIPIPEEVVEALRTLGLPSDAPFDEIHRRYRQLAKRSHPDAGGDPETFKRINAAYTCVTTWMSSQNQENT